MMGRMRNSHCRHCLQWPILGFVILLLLTRCGTLAPVTEEAVEVARETESGLSYTIHQAGTGIRPVSGDTVSVHYTARLEDGTVFDSSYERGAPIRYVLGSGRVIDGWEEGVALLREGTRATFVIPPQLAYGERGYARVPANATLTFEMELVTVTKGVAPPPPPAEEIGLSAADLPSFESLGVEWIERGTGEKLVDEMSVRLHYTGYLQDGKTVFDSSFQRGEPISFIMGRGMLIDGLEEGLRQLSVGDNAMISIPFEKAYGLSGRGPIPPRANLIFHVEVLDAQPIPTPRPYNVEGIEPLETETGLMAYIIEEGSGENPSVGDMLTVHYSGYLSDGTLFDSSVQRNEPLRFVLGFGQVIRGWDEGFAMLKKGGRARLVIPPGLAYGEDGAGPIPPGETLYFDVELLDFR